MGFDAEIVGLLVHVVDLGAFLLTIPISLSIDRGLLVIVVGRRARTAVAPLTHIYRGAMCMKHATTYECSGWLIHLSLLSCVHPLLLLLGYLLRVQPAPWCIEVTLCVFKIRWIHRYHELALECFT